MLSTPSRVKHTLTSVVLCFFLAAAFILFIPHTHAATDYFTLPGMVPAGLIPPTLPDIPTLSDTVEEPNTIFLMDNATGGDCSTVGVWNPATKTCTLTQDVTQTIDISHDVVYDNHDLTLDGAGHTITGQHTGRGINLYQVARVTVKNVIIDGFSTGIQIGAMYADTPDVTITNVTIHNSATALSVNAQNTHISDVTVAHASTTLFAYAATDLLVERLTGTDAGDFHLVGDAIQLVRPILRDVTLSGTTVHLYLNGASNATLHNVHLNGVGSPKDGQGAFFYLYGVSPEDYDHDIDETNTINGKPIRYYKHETDTTLTTDNAAEVICVFCSNVTIHPGMIENAYTGILLYDTHNSTIENATVTDSVVGITLIKSTGNTIRNNIIERVNDGIALLSSIVVGYYSYSAGDPSSDTTIEGNTIEDATYGIDLVSSNANIIRNNTLVRNTTYFSLRPFINAPSAHDNHIYRNNITDPPAQHWFINDGGGSNNVYNEPLPIGGNYWSTYDSPEEGCIDANSDYICDTSLGQDQYPWTAVSAWDIPEMISFPSDFPDGISSKKGRADTDLFVFSVIVATDTAVSIEAVVDDGGVLATTTKRVSLYATGSTTSEGGRYFVSFPVIFARGTHTYHFEATVGSTIRRLPQTDELFFSTGYDSVVFLPGIEASRLYDTTLCTRTSPPFDLYPCEQRIWEPSLSSTNEDLRMRPDGMSVRTDIYTKEVIDEGEDVTAGPNIYKTFLNDMQGMVDNHTINAFKTLPYDWRYAIDQSASGNITLATTTYRMLDMINDLASSSDSGKVTIVAHSMGGLVGKLLISELNRQDKVGEIGSFIMVATPQLGTPKAIAGLLHGYDQSLGYGFFITDKTARDLATTTPSAYDLLPSPGYFAHVSTSTVIRLDPSLGALTDDPLFNGPALRNVYGSEIKTRSNLDAFLRGDGGRHTLPTTGDLDHPTVLLPDMLTDSATLFTNQLDNWTAPANIHVVQIAGWGEETIAGVKYFRGDKARDCIIGHFGCTYYKGLSLEPMLSLDGDGTVVESSAMALGGERYWIHLKKYNQGHPLATLGGLHPFEHSNIFEVDDVRSLVENHITNSTPNTSPYIFTTHPPIDLSNQTLHLFLHSPLSLDLYDTAGNHTGVSTTTGHVETNIPGSRYHTLGEVQWISIPASTTAHVRLQGQASGSFTLNVEKTQGDRVVAATTFAAIPSSTSTVATLDIPADTTIANLSPLIVDQDGNGTSDIVLPPELNGTASLDETPPVTTLNATGTPGTNSYYTSPVTVTFSATDTVASSSIASGVEKTEYSFDSTIWNQATTSIMFATTTTLYYYSTDNLGNREAIASTTILIDTIPPATTTLLATSTGTSTIMLSWATSTDNIGINGYQIFRATSSTATTSLIATTSATTTIYTNTNLTASTTYWYQVKAFDLAGNISSSSNKVSTTTLKIVVDATPPISPTILTATPASTTQIRLTWATSTDPSVVGQITSGVAGYQIFRATSSTATTSRIATTTATTYTDYGLIASTTYWYTVRAIDLAGNRSSSSNKVSTTTLMLFIDTTPPTKPTTLTATSASTTIINLSWTPSTDNVGVIGYKVERCTGATCTNFLNIATTSATSTYINTGLTASTTYRFRTRAFDAVGNNSVYSSITSATTKKLPQTIFSDGFESALNWIKVAPATWYTDSPKIGTHAARLQTKGSIEKAISLANYSTITISFLMGANSLDTASENVQALYYNGTAWVTLATIANNSTNENNKLNPYSFTLPASMNNTATFKLKFTINGSATDDYAFVDEVKVIGTHN